VPFLARLLHLLLSALVVDDVSGVTDASEGVLHGDVRPYGLEGLFSPTSR
jgi:hypothetical protein